MTSFFRARFTSFHIQPLFKPCSNLLHSVSLSISRFHSCYGLRGVSWWLCVCFTWLDMTTPPWCREKVMVYYYLLLFLLFTCASVWENTRAWVPHFLWPNWMVPSLLAMRNTLFEPKLRLSNQIKLNLSISSVNIDCVALLAGSHLNY